MAYDSSQVMTLADLASAQGADKKILRIAEIMTQKNEILDDMMWKEGNLTDSNSSAIRTGLPSVAWR